MKLKIVTRKGVVFDRQVEKAYLKTQKGDLEILSNHAPAILILEPGEIKYDDYKTNISGGILKVENNEVLIAAEA